MYCFKCKKNTKSKNIHYEKERHINFLKKGNCVVCGTKVNRFVKSTQLPKNKK